MRATLVFFVEANGLSPLFWTHINPYGRFLRYVRHLSYRWGAGT